MTIESTVMNLISEILDIDLEDITPESYVIRELNAESIDLLELGAELGSRFRVQISDDAVFFLKLREYAQKADAGNNLVDLITNAYPHLSEARINEIAKDMAGGPVLKVKDITAYMSRLVAL